MHRVFLTTGEVGLFAAAMTGTAAVGGAWLQSRRDDKRWERERQREQERWAREDRARWHDERLKAYSEYTARVDAIRLGLLQIQETDPDSQVSDELLASGYDAQARAVLLASADTREALRRIWDIVMKLTVAVHGISVGGENFDVLHDGLQTAISAFFLRARLELDIELLPPNTRSVAQQREEVSDRD